MSPIPSITGSPFLLCLGFGRIAQALARFLTQNPAHGWVIAGTTRSVDRAAELRAAGIVVLSLEEAMAPAVLGRATHVLASIPPDDDGDPALRLWRKIKCDPKDLRWVGYLSTTGIYGDLRGRWAFEWTPPAPLSVEAQRRARAEADWLHVSSGANIFRLPGLYGEGRSAFDRLRDGSARRIVKPGHIFSRVHEDDVAAALAASIARATSRGIYNICDDEPAPPQDIIACAAQLLGVDAPPEISIEAANLSPAAQRFYAESKRVSNARAKSELGWRPIYPTYREGLTAILAAERAKAP